MMTTPGEIDISENQTCGCFRFIRVPLCRQETEYTCGIACMQSILGCYGFDYRQDQLAQIMQSKPILGTDHQDIIRFMQLIGLQASFLTNMSIDCLKSFINDGVTPMLMIQAWADNGVDYDSDWKDSHYVIACGYEGDRIFFMDPDTLGYYTYIPVHELLKRWHVPDVSAGRCYRSGLIIKKEHCSFNYDPKDVKYLG